MPPIWSGQFLATYREREETLMRKRAVVLLSGGLDSATAAAVARRDGFDVFALSFDYGQRHRAELDAARAIAAVLPAIDHKIVSIDLRTFGGSALTAEIEVPTDRDVGQMSNAIPVTYVPGRNTIFLSFALAFAEVAGANDIFIGVNALDYSGYPDCRPEYIHAYEAMARLATKAAVEGAPELNIHTPLIDLSKADIVRLAVALAMDLSLTVSCYNATSAGEACGHCDSCLLRMKGFAEAGVLDPTRYAPGA
jgi:7-cyano-7-deazaguanine synthase